MSTLVKRVVVVCEGETEEEFVRDVLAPGFCGTGLYLEPQMVETSPGNRGGALNYDRVKPHLRNVLRQKSMPVVTTLFDLYKLDRRFPGFERSRGLPDLGLRLAWPRCCPEDWPGQDRGRVRVLRRVACTNQGFGSKMTS